MECCRRNAVSRAKGHTSSITLVTYSPDGTRIATASLDHTVKIRDAVQDLETMTLRGHTDAVTCVTFSPNGWWVISGGMDGTVRLWNATPFD